MYFEALRKYESPNTRIRIAAKAKDLKNIQVIGFYKVKGIGILITKEPIKLEKFSLDGLYLHIAAISRQHKDTKAVLDWVIRKLWGVKKSTPRKPDLEFGQWYDRHILYKIEKHQIGLKRVGGWAKLVYKDFPISPPSDEPYISKRP